MNIVILELSYELFDCFYFTWYGFNIDSLVYAIVNNRLRYYVLMIFVKIIYKILKKVD